MASSACRLNGRAVCVALRAMAAASRGNNSSNTRSARSWETLLSQLRPSASAMAWKLRPSGSHGCGRKSTEEHTSELQPLMRNSYAVTCFKKNKHTPLHIISLLYIISVRHSNALDTTHNYHN